MNKVIEIDHQDMHNLLGNQHNHTPEGILEQHEI